MIKILSINKILTAEEYGYVKDLCDDCLDKLHMFLNGAELILEDVKND